MSQLLKMTIPGNPEYIQIGRMAVGSAAALEGFNIDCVEDIKMAVGEACKAITCHGHEMWSISYDIECSMDGKAICITVKDSGKGHSLMKGARPCLDCPKEGDLGIEIIKSLMDEVEIKRADEGCKTISMVKNIC